MSRWARRTDANHAAIRDGLRLQGYDVRDFSACGHGVPDLCVVGGRGRTYVLPLWLEVKDGTQPASARRLTDAELAAVSVFRTRVVLCVEDAVALAEVWP